MTTALVSGTFDNHGLHAGHLTTLMHARTCADWVIAATNTDDVIHRIKGEGRPLASLPERLYQLSACRYVDAVVAFSEETPARLLLRLAAEHDDLVFIKGADTDPDHAVGPGVGQWWLRSVGIRLSLAPIVWDELHTSSW